MMKLKIKSIISIMLVVLILLLNVNIVYAAGSFSVSGGGSIDIGKTTTISISTANCAGKFSITSSNNSIASVSSSDVFVDGSNSITITGKSAGTAQITITAEDVTDTDENAVTGSRFVTITVVDPTPAPEPTPTPEPTPEPEPTPDTNTGSTTPDTNSGSNPGTSSDSGSDTIVTTKSSDATLKNLGIRPNDFSGFRKNTTTYNHEVSNEVDKVEVYAEVAGKNATIVSGTGTKNLVVGLNKLNVVVRAEDGTEKTYTINLTRKEAEEEEEQEDEPVVEETIGLKTLTIAGLKLSPEFDSKVYNYTVKLTEDLEKLEIKTEGTLENSKIEITGNENLKDGENIITIIVTNDNTEEIATYQIIVNKEVQEIVETVGNTEIDKNEEEPKKEEKSIPKIYLILAAIVVIAIIILLITLKSSNSKNKENVEEDFEEDVNDFNNNTGYEEFNSIEQKNPFEEQQINYNLNTERDNSAVEKIFGKKGKHS